MGDLLDDRTEELRRNCGDDDIFLVSGFLNICEYTNFGRDLDARQK